MVSMPQMSAAGQTAPQQSAAAIGQPQQQQQPGLMGGPPPHQPVHQQTGYQRAPAAKRRSNAIKIIDPSTLSEVEVGGDKVSQ
jgi:hypothetical protein